jgi:hypothetical protein
MFRVGITSLHVICNFDPIQVKTNNNVNYIRHKTQCSGRYEIMGYYIAKTKKLAVICNYSLDFFRQQKRIQLKSYTGSYQTIKTHHSNMFLCCPKGTERLKHSYCMLVNYFNIQLTTKGKKMVN